MANPKWGKWNIDWEDERERADRMGEPYEPPKKEYTDDPTADTVFDEVVKRFTEEKKEDEG